MSTQRPGSRCEGIRQARNDDRQKRFRPVRGFASEVEIDAEPSNGLNRRSAAQCQHVRAVAASRIEDRLGNVGAATLAQIREVLGLILDVPG